MKKGRFSQEETNARRWVHNDDKTPFVFVFRKVEEGKRGARLRRKVLSIRKQVWRVYTLCP